MNIFINYLIEANIGLIFFMLLYWLLLRKENQFPFQRVYLVSAMLLSVTIPLLHFNLSSQRVIPSIGNVLPSSWLPEIVVYANAAPVAVQETGSPAWSVLEWTYVVILLTLTAVFIFQLGSILRLFLNSKKYQWENCLVSETDENKPTFSFFRFIYIGQANKLTGEEKEEILFHESIHASKAHTFDILVVNILGILFWFNPIIRIYKSLLSQLHEFEADARSIQNKDVEVYCGLLAKVALQSTGFPLVNHFNQSLTLERINMMKKMKQKIQQWKIAAMVITIPLLFVGIACQDQIGNDIAKSSITQMGEYPAEVQTALANLKAKYPNETFTYVQGSMEDMEKLMGNAEKLKFTRGVFLWKGEDGSRTLGAILSDVAKHAEDLRINGDVFTIVEESASPIGGIPELYSYIAKNVRYPASARREGKEGKVFVEFIVNTDGKLSDFNVVNSIDPALAEEAIRVLQGGPDWIPGKQRGIAVRQRYTVPIFFKLGTLADSKNSGVPGKLEETLQKMTVEYQKNTIGEKIRFTGRVLSPNGVPIPGANIVQKGTFNGTVTDSSGAFTFETESTEALVVSFVGFESKEIQFWKEIVVVGYGNK